MEQLAWRGGQWCWESGTWWFLMDFCEILKVADLWSGMVFGGDEFFEFFEFLDFGFWTMGGDGCFGMWGWMSCRIAGELFLN